MTWLPSYPGGSAPAEERWKLDPFYQDYLANQANTARLNATGVPPRSDLEAVASTPQETQATLIAANAPLRIIYGRQRVGAHIANALVYNNQLVIQSVWGEGEIDSVESYTIGNAAPLAGVTATHYTGTSGQTVNATLVAAFAAVGITYADALPGIAYSVFQIPVGASEGFPTIEAIIKGLKVYDDRTGMTVWSDNPALCLADFISSTVYGLGRDVDWDSVALVADDNDEMVADFEPRRRVGLVIDATAPTRQHVEALRAYAGCLAFDDVNLGQASDDPTDTEHVVTAADIMAGSLKLTKLGVQQSPTVIDVRWTDTTVTPWAERSAIVEAPGVSTGTVPRRESKIPLPGIQSYSQAIREATERLNHFLLEDLEVEWTGFDEALMIKEGHLVEITHPIGLESKLVQVTAKEPAGAGRWRITAKEYDPEVYSDAVQTEPSYPDTPLPNPASPPAVTSLAVAEEVYQLQDGSYASRLRATWDAVTYPYFAYFRAELWAGPTLIHTTTTRDAVWPTPTVQEGVVYTVKVVAASTIGATGTWATQSVTPAGQYLIPGDVPSLTGFESGGAAYLAWEPAADIGILLYDVRYGATDCTWDAATSIDLVAALRLTTTEIPVGTWDCLVKARDAVGLYSANAARCALTVTYDSAAFLVDSYQQEAPTLTNMASYQLNRHDGLTHYITEDGVAFGTKFSAAMSTYTEPLATYHSSLTSEWVGEGEDFGQSLSGEWKGEATVSALSGTVETGMELAPDSTNYLRYPGLSHNLTARFARLYHSALTTSTLYVVAPSQIVRLDAIAREEVGSGTSSASEATLVTLANEYTAAKRITVLPSGSSARIPTYDRVLVGPAGTLIFQDESDTDEYDSWDYRSISTASRTIASGDHLEYDVKVLQRPVAATEMVGGMGIEFTDATNSWDDAPLSTVVDEAGITIRYGTPLVGQWVSRKMDISAAAGKIVANWILIRSANPSGQYKAAYRNIRITDGAGTTRQTVWSSGEPQANVSITAGHTINAEVGPANSFQVNVFNSSAARVADAFQYSFQGV